MGFGTGKLPGVNNTHKKNMQKLVNQGYTPQEISDKLQVVLPCILSFYPLMGGKGIEDFPTVDTSIPGNADALVTAAQIIADAEAKAAEIAGEAMAKASGERESTVKAASKASKLKVDA
jgi:hypothetical protein